MKSLPFGKGYRLVLQTLVYIKEKKYATYCSSAGNA
jgi:hypothetical protein